MELLMEIESTREWICEWKQKLKVQMELQTSMEFLMGISSINEIANENHKHEWN